MKKAAAVLLALAMVFTMSACVNGQIDPAQIQELMEQVDMEKVGEVLEQTGLQDVITQFLFSTGMEEAQEVELPEQGVKDPEKMLFPTIADARKAEDEIGSISFDEKYLIYIFTVDGEPYRLVVETGEELYSKLSAATEEENFPEKGLAMVADLPVACEEDLYMYALSQEELDEFVGKTGQELLDAGFEAGSYNEALDAVYIGMEKGVILYDFYMNEDLGGYDHWEENFKDATVEHVEMEGLSSYASDITVTDGK